MKIYVGSNADNDCSIWEVQACKAILHPVVRPFIFLSVSSSSPPVLTVFCFYRAASWSAGQASGHVSFD